ncbi:hypothetical protein [Nocardia nova]|uniref:hypothetical protein n=1 Tax=Nocardia nova TaxID=37330 RepID=UPI0011B0B6BE|nr:hypothetical protein [Nocardia nova]
MTAQSSQPFPRTGFPRATAARTVPSTLWAAGTDPVDPDDRWPAPIVSRAVTEFCAPGGRVLLVPWPAPATRGPLTVMAPDTAAALTAVDRLDRTARIESGVSGSVRANELVLASLLVLNSDPVAAADRVVELADARLSEGGLLVVLSRCHHSDDGVLSDPAGAIVAAAQAADLLYLQHIIAAPLHGDTVTGPDAPVAPARHTVAHIDLLLFLRPESVPAFQR